MEPTGIQKTLSGSFHYLSNIIAEGRFGVGDDIDEETLREEIEKILDEDLGG